MRDTVDFERRNLGAGSVMEVSPPKRHDVGTLIRVAPYNATGIGRKEFKIKFLL